jgi:hypothetical protein
LNDAPQLGQRARASRSFGMHGPSRFLGGRGDALAHEVTPTAVPMSNAMSPDNGLESEGFKMTSEQRKEFDRRRRSAQIDALVQLGGEGLLLASMDGFDDIPMSKVCDLAKAMIQRRIEELQALLVDFNAKMAWIDDVEEEAEAKFHCDVDGCDQPHCRECGRHYDGIGATCAGCDVERARDEMAEVSAAFGGNHEEAARFMGW